MGQRKKVKVKSLSHVRLLATPWTAAYQVPPSMGFFQARVLGWVSIAFSAREKMVNDGWNAMYSDSYGGWTQDKPSLTMLYFPRHTHTHTHTHTRTHTHLCLASLLIQILRETWILNRLWTTFNSTYLIYPKNKLFLSSLNLLPDLYVSTFLFLIRNQYFLSLWDLKVDSHPSLHQLLLLPPQQSPGLPNFFLILLSAPW